MDGPGDYHTKWGKLDREKQISITHIWNLKKWSKWPYLQNRKILIDLEDELMVTGWNGYGEG